MIDNQLLGSNMMQLFYISFCSVPLFSTYISFIRLSKGSYLGSSFNLLAWNSYDDLLIYGIFQEEALFYSLEMMCIDQKSFLLFLCCFFLKSQGSHFFKTASSVLTYSYLFLSILICFFSRSLSSSA